MSDPDPATTKEMKEELERHIASAIPAKPPLPLQPKRTIIPRMFGAQAPPPENATQGTNNKYGTKRLRREEEPEFPLGLNREQIGAMLKWVLGWLQVTVDMNWSGYVVSRMQTNLMMAMRRDDTFRLIEEQKAMADAPLVE